MQDSRIREAVLRTAAPGLESIVAEMKFDLVTHCWCGGLLEKWLPEFEPYHQCRDCECKSVQYRPTNESLEIFYSRYYWHAYQTIHGCSSVAERYESDMLDRVPIYLKWIQQLRVPPARALEIGCGNGRLLNEMASRGYECSGCELDPSVADWVSERTGLKIYRDPLPVPSEGNFDLILMIDVLEHVADPLHLVREVSSRLNPRGKMLLHCPVINGPEAAIRLKYLFNPLSHLFMHTTGSLSKLWSLVDLHPRLLGELFEMPCFSVEDSVSIGAPASA